MQFNTLPADLAANCNTKIFTAQSCKTQYAMPVSIVHDHMYNDPMCGALVGVLDSRSIYLTFPTSGYEPATRSHVLANYVISFDVCWEDVMGGRSVVVVKHVGGDQANANFLKVFEIFEYMLNRRLRTVLPRL